MLLSMCVHLAVASSQPYFISQDWSGFGNNAQHTAQSNIPSLALDAIAWKSAVDLNPPYSGDALLAHYGSPVVTAADTVITPVKTGLSDGFKVMGRRGSDGSIVWHLASTYSVPPHGWFPSFNVTLLPPAIPGGPTRVAWPESGGRISIRSNADQATATKVVKAFYGNNFYRVDPANYDSAIKICTPLTAGPDGSIYFGYTVLGTNPSALTSGLAKINPDGTGRSVAASALSGDAGIADVKQNCAPALSNDGQYVYIVVYSGGYGAGRLVRAATSNLQPAGAAALIDPSSGLDAHVDSDGTASPMVAPDGDVYTGVLENGFGSHHYRGWLLHFSDDLQTLKTPGSFGWDNTPSVVPAEIVPFYHGASSYLLFCKYNNYAGGGGDGVNRIALIDPLDTQVDSISGNIVMKEVATQQGVTKDPEFINNGFPNAVREWCVNSGVVDIPGKCILANNEDGVLYRWNLTTNTLSEKIRLNRGIGQAYTTTLIGPTGRVYATSNAKLYAVGTVPR
jgi:hypothetical protein